MEERESTGKTTQRTARRPEKRIPGTEATEVEDTAATTGPAGSAEAGLAEAAKPVRTAPAAKRPRAASPVPAKVAKVAAPAQPRNPVADEIARVKLELDRSNALLRRLLRELDDRGPNSPSVPVIWSSVRDAAATSDQLLQRLDRLRAQLEQEGAAN